MVNNNPNKGINPEGKNAQELQKNIRNNTIYGKRSPKKKKQIEISRRDLMKYFAVGALSGILGTVVIEKKAMPEANMLIVNGKLSDNKEEILDFANVQYQMVDGKLVLDGSIDNINQLQTVLKECGFTGDDIVYYVANNLGNEENGNIYLTAIQSKTPTYRDYLKEYYSNQYGDPLSDYFANRVQANGYAKKGQELLDLVKEEVRSR